MDESPEAIAEKTIELAKSTKSITNQVVSSIIPRRDQQADKGSKVNSVVENFCNEDQTIKFIWQKSLDSKKDIAKDGIYLNNSGISQVVKIFIEFLNNDLYYNFGDIVGNIDINESIQETHCIITSNCNKRTNELANSYVQNTLDISEKESNRKLNSLSELKEMRKSCVKK